jgi:ADP-ribosylglycohydrolase
VAPTPPENAKYGRAWEPGLLFLGSFRSFGTAPCFFIHPAEVQVMKSIENTVLFGKIFGSLAASAIGDAMGAPVEGWDWPEIEERYGKLDHFLTYDREPDYHSNWEIAPGSITDDTRFRDLLCEVIIAEGGAPTRGAFNKAIADYYYQADENLPRGFMEEYFLKVVHQDRMQIWGGQPVSAALMMNSPLGLIFPGDPLGAFAAGQEIDFLSAGYAQVAANIAAAAVAAAMVPGITIEQVIERALQAAETFRVQGPLFTNWHYSPAVGQPVERLIETAVELALKTPDVYELREQYYEKLQYLPIMVDAGQAIAVTFGMLVAAGGDLRLSLLGTINYGRDNDTYASVAGAIAGAMHGIDALPPEWVKTIHDANPQSDQRAYAQGLAEVVTGRQEQMRLVLGVLDQLAPIG